MEAFQIKSLLHTGEFFEETEHYPREERILEVELGYKAKLMTSQMLAKEKLTEDGGVNSAWIDDYTLNYYKGETLITITIKPINIEY